MNSVTANVDSNDVNYNSTTALGERKHQPTLCQFFRCVRQVVALY